MRDDAQVTDWRAWHDAYDDPSTSLARRLVVVRRRLTALLDAAADQPQRLLSLCAGEGRDVVPVLAARPASSSVSAVLVEADEVLARRARESASACGLGSVEVRCADAGDPRSFSDVGPVDVLLLCGIFGNIEHARVHDVVQVVPGLLAPGGSVIWTRGASDPDRRPDVRRWMRAAGLEEISFDGAEDSYGVGVNRLAALAPRTRPALPGRLFEFVQP